MLTSKLGFCGALCSVLFAVSACSHDTTPAQTASNAPPSSTTTENTPPTENQGMTNGYQPQTGAGNIENPGTNTGLSNTTGSSMSGTGTGTTPGSTSTYPSSSGSMNGTGQYGQYGQSGQTGQTGQTGQYGQGGQQTQTSMMVNDDDILAIMQAINKGEIQEAQLAKTKAQSADVRSFANMMLSEHSTALQQENALTTQAHITPNTSNSTCQQLTTDSRQELDTLQNKTGKDFDTAYIDAMVQGHQKALSLINDTLLPNAKDPQLKTQLSSLKTHVEMHLRHALDAQQKLNGSSSSSSQTPGQSNSMPGNNGSSGSGNQNNNSGNGNGNGGTTTPNDQRKP